MSELEASVEHVDWALDPEIEKELNKLDSFAELPEWAVVIDRRPRNPERPKREKELVDLIEQYSNEISQEGHDEFGRVDKELKTWMMKIILAADRRREEYGLSLYSRDSVITLVYEIWYTDHLHRNHTRRSGDNYARTHLFGATMNAIVDTGVNSLSSIITLLRHDDLEDYKEMGFDKSRPDKLLCSELYLHKLDGKEMKKSPEDEVSKLRSRVKSQVKALTNIKTEAAPKEVKELEREKNFRQELANMFRYGYRAIRSRLNERSHNVDTIATNKADRRIPILEETLTVHLRVADVLELCQVEAHLVEGSYAYLDPEALMTFRLRQGEVLERRFGADKTNSKLHKCLRAVIETSPEILLTAIKPSRFNEYVTGYVKNASRVINEIDDWDPMFEVVVLVKKEEDVVKVKGDLARFGTIKNTIDNGNTGNHFVLFNKELGGRVKFRINTEEKEKLIIRGVLAPDGREEDIPHLRAAIKLVLDKTLHTDGAGTFELAKRYLKGGRVKVYTPEMDEIDMPAGSNGIDYAAAVHGNMPAELRGMRVRNDRYTGTEEWRSPFDELHSGEVARVVKEDSDVDKYSIDPGWYNFAGAEATHAIKKLFKRRPPELRKEFGENHLLDLADILGFSTPSRNAEFGFGKIMDTLMEYLGERDSFLGLRALELQYKGLKKRRRMCRDRAECDNIEKELRVLRVRIVEAKRVYEEASLEICKKIAEGEINPLEVFAEKMTVNPVKPIRAAFALPNQQGILEDLSGMLRKANLNVGVVQQQRHEDPDKAILVLDLEFKGGKGAVLELMKTLLKIHYIYPVYVLTRHFLEHTPKVVLTQRAVENEAIPTEPEPVH